MYIWIWDEIKEKIKAIHKAQKELALFRKMAGSKEEGESDSSADGATEAQNLPFPVTMDHL